MYRGSGARFVREDSRAPMAKILKFDEDARRALERGVDMLAYTV